MRIGIVGANGLLGRALVSFLKDKCKLFVFSKEELDITKLSSIEGRLGLVEINALVNCAAYTDVDGCEDNEKLAYEVNGIGPGNLARFSFSRKIKLVHISTDYIFDGNKKNPYKETDEPNPLSIYAKSKLEGEKRVIENTDDYIILRVSWLFGPYKKSFVSWVIDKLNKDEKIYVVEDQIGAPTYTIDLAKAIIRLLEINYKGIIHYRNDGECSREEQARHIAKLSNLNEELLIPAKASEIYRKARRPSYSVLDTSLYQEITKEKIRSWKDAIKEYIELRLNK